MSVPENSVWKLAADIETLAIDLMTEEHAPGLEPYDKVRALSIIINLTLKIKRRAWMSMRYIDNTPPANDKYVAALMEIEQRFRGKQSLHKDDCFAYQVASKALGSAPPTEEQRK